MRLASYYSSGGIRLGAASGEWMIDLNRASREALRAENFLRPEGQADCWCPPCMTRFLEGGETGMLAARRAMAFAEAAISSSTHREDLLRNGVISPLKDVRLAPPVPRPGKIICIGKNYAEHAQELGGKQPDQPELFARFPATLLGHGQPVLKPLATDQWDYEAELAVVIGKKGRRIPIEKAMDHVAGYSCFNDVSARDFQLRISQWTAGKNFDASGPMGPFLVTTDEVGDPQSLGLRLEIGNEVMQSSNTKNMVFSVAFLIAHLSEFTTLEPGDIIATGTPGGVGMARKPPRFLRPGETVRVVIERVGVLENPVVAETER